MSERSKRISRLLESASSRASYIRAKLNLLIPSQIRALRLRRDNMTQAQLAQLADMAQPRISAMERPGEVAFNIETLVRLAAAFKLGLRVEFVPFSEMIAWENNYSQDAFNPPDIGRDEAFLRPVMQPVTVQPAARQLAVGFATRSTTINFTQMVINIGINALHPQDTADNYASREAISPQLPAAREEQLTGNAYNVPWELLPQGSRYVPVLEPNS